ncbi:Olfactory receptor 4F21 [Sciurus carolinensis]|uniref:Olfactory receptor 4F21 n=1 Tax=Sciurus carolinensis TaxID=30640 RepID=A0AA41MPL9_SCICA|nr:Olfactory receptor 4F21 [Sciurus carolinensis]
MDGLNGSVVSEFVLLGLSGSWETKVTLTLTFFLLYLGIILGNLFIVFLVIANSHLHSPMYFLLANLSFNDVGLSSTTVPRMISDLLKEHRAISFQSCMIQTCFIHAMGGTELVLLITMAFDRYVAICGSKPVLMTTAMDGLNGSVVSEFVLLGLSGSWETKVFLTLTLSLLYLRIILGNLFIVFLVIVDSHLHTPMYFLLANLSFNDIGVSSTAVPRMISDLLKEHRVISFQSCMIQTCFIHALGGKEMLLFITMAFDRYAAI